MKILNYKEVKLVLSFQNALNWISEYFTYKAKGNIIEPDRNIYEFQKGSYSYVGSAFLKLPYHTILGTKILSFNPKYGGKANLSSIRSVINLFDYESHDVLALMDGRFILYMRTAATLALFLNTYKELFHNSLEIGILGAGQMLYFTIGFLKLLYPNSILKIYSPHAAMKRRHWIGRIASEFDVDLHIVSKELTVDSEIVILQTNEMKKCVLDNVSPKTRLVAGIGSISPNYIGEIGENVYSNAKLIIFDDKNKVILEHGQLKRILENKDIETLNIEKYHERKRTENEIYHVFRSVGLNSQDIFFAYKVYAISQESNIGIKIQELNNFHLEEVFG